MGNKCKILKTYEPCTDGKCINAVLVKKVFEDLNYIPLCNDCMRKHRRRIKEFKKHSVFLSIDEITNTYFDTLNMRGKHGFI